MNYDLPKVTARLAALCAKAEHCSGELDDKMRRWGVDADDRQTVMDYLTAHHYVDDSRYCEAFIEDKIKFNQWGRRKIEQALWAKHVPESISAPLLDCVPDEAYVEQLLPLLRQKWPTIKAETGYERSMKLIKFAMGRGYSMEQVRQCIDALGAEDAEDDR